MYNREKFDEANRQFLMGFNQWKHYAIAMAKLNDIAVVFDSGKPDFKIISAPISWGEASIEEPERFEREKVKLNLEKKISELNNHLQRFQNRLADPGFIKAGFEKKAEMEDRLIEVEIQLMALENQVKALS